MTTTYKFYVYVSNSKQWYSVMNECRKWFNTNWRSQPRTLRKIKQLNYIVGGPKELPVWFEVPDPRWATWIGTKFALRVASEDKYKTGK